MRKPLIDVVLAVASGALWAVCFGVETSVWLGWVALVPFLTVLAGEHVTPRRAALLGLVHGFVFWLISVYWIPATIHTFGGIPTALAWGLLCLMCLFLALFRAAFAWVARRLLRAGGVLAWLGLPAVWVMTEWLYGNALGTLSFPWNLAAYAWIDVPGVLPLAAWIGPWGVSYLAVAVNAALASAWRARSGAGAAAAVLSALLLLAFAARWSRPAEDLFDGGQPVAVFQPNRGLQSTAEEAERQYVELLRISRSECERAEPTLLVWPESAAFPHTWDGSWRLRQDLGDLTSRGCSVIFNTPVPDPGDPEAYYNSALLIGAAPGEPAALPAALGRYDKRFLVPWGEHVPFGDLLPFVDKLARLAGRFSRGTEPGLLEWRGERLGVAICYEAVFPGGMADQVRAGATLLVNISNDAWYGDTSAPRQLLRAARFRAAEHRRPMIRAALTGISVVVDARGRVRQRLELGRLGLLRERLRGTAELTPYARAPWLGPLIGAILGAGALIRSRRT